MPTITYTIPSAHPLNQLAAPTYDHAPDEDARENCVPTSIAEGLHILTGRDFVPDELHDAVYGQGYRGTQAASAYVHYCHEQGVTLAPFNSTNQSDLVARLRYEVEHGHPVVLTMPSQWNTPPSDPLHPSGYTHVGVAVGFGGTTGQADAAIRVMNPWGGFWQDELDAWWAQRLCYGQIWIMSHIPAPVVAPTLPKLPVVAPTPKPAPKPAPQPAAVNAPVATPQPPDAAQPAPVVAQPPQLPDLPLADSPQIKQPPSGGLTMSNPFTLFARAAAGLHLTPGERAFLKLAKGVLFTVIVAALGVAMPLISSGHFTLNTATVQAIVGAGAVAGLSALEKLFSAKGDAQQPSQPPSA